MVITWVGSFILASVVRLHVSSWPSPRRPIPQLVPRSPDCYLREWNELKAHTSPSGFENIKFILVVQNRVPNEQIEGICKRWPRSIQ